MKKKFVTILLTVSMTVLLLAGCGKDSSTDIVADEESVVIAVGNAEEENTETVAENMDTEDADSAVNTTSTSISASANAFSFIIPSGYSADTLNDGGTVWSYTEEGKGSHSLYYCEQYAGNDSLAEQLLDNYKEYVTDIFGSADITEEVEIGSHTFVHYYFANSLQVDDVSVSTNIYIASAAGYVVYFEFSDTETGYDGSVQTDVLTSLQDPEDGAAAGAIEDNGISIADQFFGGELSREDVEDILSEYFATLPDDETVDAVTDILNNYSIAGMIQDLFLSWDSLDGSMKNAIAVLGNIGMLGDDLSLYDGILDVEELQQLMSETSGSLQ